MAQVDRFADQRTIFRLRYKLPPTDGTLALLKKADEEARVLNHNYIGTEHLLLGAFATEEGRSPLVTLGANLDQTKEAVVIIIGIGQRDPVGDIGLTPRAKRTMENSAKEARRLHDREVGTDHVLLALTLESGSVAEKVLEALNIHFEQLRTTVLEERAERVQAMKPIPDNPFAKLSAVRRLLLDPSTTQQDQKLIGSALGLIYKTYGPKPEVERA